MDQRQAITGQNEEWLTWGIGLSEKEEACVANRHERFTTTRTE